MAHVREVERKAGRAFEVRWRDGGKERQRTFTVKRDAERFALKVENAKAEGSTTAPLTRSAPTFREVAEAMTTAQHDLKQKTRDYYDAAFRVHVYPTFGARRVHTITPAEVEQWLATLRATPKANGQPRSETSVLGIYKCLARVFRYALAHRLIVHDPCAPVRRPRPDTAEARFLSVAEVESLAAHLDAGHPDAPYGLAVRLAAYTGLRAGELAALRVSDVDLLHAEVRVHRTMSHTSRGYLVSTPKTAHSRREVPILVDGLVEALRDHLATHPYAADPDASLWPGKVPGHRITSYDRPFDPKGFYRYTFRPAAKAVGLGDLKMHELRHTFATLVLESGAFDMFTLSRLMGHSSITITDRVYAHLRRKDYSAQRAAFSAFVTGASAPPAPLARIA